jgi:phytanoyl-CoA hydroxylase
MLLHTCRSQDLAFLEPECEATPFANFWIPLQPITTITNPATGKLLGTNGGLLVAPRSHAAGALPHVKEGPPVAPYTQVTLDMAAVGGVLPGSGVPVLVDDLPVGGGVLFTHKTLHSSRANLSDGARWSLDIRYSALGQPTGRPLVPGFVGRSRTVAANTHEEWLAALEQGDKYVPLTEGGQQPSAGRDVTVRTPRL